MIAVFLAGVVVGVFGLATVSLLLARFLPHPPPPADSRAALDGPIQALGGHGWS